MDDFLNARKQKRVDELAQFVDMDELVDIFSQLIQRGVDREMAANLVLGESMAMAVAENTDANPMFMNESAEPLIMSIGLMEGSEPVLLEHVLRRSGA